MRNDRDFLMKELKKSSSSSSPHNNIHPHSDNSIHPRSDNNIHPRSDSNSSSKKDSIIWKVQAITVHLAVETDLHKVERKIIS
jgi:hypothetical protein